MKVYQAHVKTNEDGTLCVNCQAPTRTAALEYVTNRMEKDAGYTGVKIVGMWPICSTAALTEGHTVICGPAK